jgi:hypothetical protein
VQRSNNGFTLLSCLFLCLAAYLMGQAPTAQITGVITDPSSAVIPAAEVTLLNQATGIESTKTVRADGRYLALALPPGRYTITARATGFKSTVIKDVLLEVDHEARLDIRLAVGTVGEQVTVSGEAPLLQAEGASMGTVVDQKLLSEMPLNGRNFVALATLAPGASEGWSNSFQKLTFGQRSEYSIVQTNGLRSEYTSTTVDGVNTQTNLRHWTSEIYPSVDMLQEFKSETSNYSTEFSKTGGVVLNLVTKSGGNQVHGSAFESLQNRVLNAKNYFQAPYLAKPNEIYNQFGATVGGPLWIPHLYQGKNKTFFFLSYQGLRIRVPIPKVGSYPKSVMAVAVF